MKSTKSLSTILLIGVLCNTSQSAQELIASSPNTAGNTVLLESNPQRDSVFKADYKLKPIGAFNTDDISNLQFTVIPAPDFYGHTLKRDMKRKQVKLQQVSRKANSITDEEEWYANNNLTKREQRIQTPMDRFGPRFSYKTGGYLATTYGEHYGNTLKLVITDEQQQTLFAAYDFAKYEYSPKTTLMGNTQGIRDVMIEGNVLYFVHSSNSYSDGAGYQTGYITAFDMEKQEIIWTTEPMTCNSQFTIYENSILCGYGFTNEPDNLFVLDKYSGRRVQKISMKKMVEDIVVRDGMAYVRTYSFDYIFKIK